MKFDDTVNKRPVLVALKLALLLFGFAILAACGSDAPPQDVRLTEKPDRNAAVASLPPQISDLGVRLRVAYQDLNALAAVLAPESQRDEGSNRLCKRVIGIKVCGTVRWDYELHRTDDVTISGKDGKVHFSVPLEIAGTAGIKGDLALSLIHI